MKIFVRAKSKSKKEYIKKIDNTHFTVAVTAPPIEGKANLAIIKSLSKYFHKPASGIQIISGAKSKEKIVDIDLF
ncbi:hypothetical protein A3D77_07215 [Candidatus Gottesmanbacteria bacterium RIFCSPHIGHO2_02_FULL_39_11]|uniref:Uncharacterized protein n=1 Tax=Candidatus Gottesmanbacteria bacterium RIFCSPHIGHO2_02_FULL_39_11 TaxID=1798382 RepID=A0A1F5ZK16_9BACT|nr:MAG: hypothetical protein A3D77_07215 [Candidatus Gottesmanbacteria bacterium RIFCSPHIGHO2_02_FULL_39_11]